MEFIMVSFVNVFLSYFILFAVIAVVAGCAVALGITLRKKKNAKESQAGTASTDAE